MAVGARYTGQITVKNSGTTTWSENGGVGSRRLGSQNPGNNTTWGPDNRLKLLPGESVPPGASKTFTAIVQAPSIPGSYDFQWQMVHEGVSHWFGDKTPNLTINVVVPSSVAASSEADFEKAWSVGDTKWFGADLWFGATDWLQSLDYVGYSIATQGKAIGYLLGYSKVLGKAETTFAIPSAGVTTTSSGYLNLFGTDVAKWSQKLEGPGTFRTQPCYSKKSGGKAGFSIGPVGVRLSVDAEVTTFAAGSQTIEYSLNRPPVKKIKAGPALDGAVTGNVVADIYVLGAGLDASLELTDWALNSEIVVLPRASSSAPPQASWKISADSTATTGKLEGWVRVGIAKPLPIKKTFRKTFADYNGGPTSKILSQGSR
ncbi:MAG: NBR1-Ig-like domain-containing protein [Verrucomicrobiia bacterium]